VTAAYDIADVTGTIFDLDTFAIHDGPGIRMTVYLKGCPLHCAWCHSPESQSSAPQLVFARDNCLLCGACVTACPLGAHRIEDGQHTLVRDRCQACGACAAVCSHRALAVKGYAASAREIVARARRQRPFFRHSGGGVTVTGGEVTTQPAFAAAILQGCQAAGIHTAIETCGACSWSVLEGLLVHTDLVLYDLKLMDDDDHRRWVGASNRAILANAANLGASAWAERVLVRTPLIPNITDTAKNLRAVFGFMREAGLRRVALLPYNPSSAAKYEWLGRPYAIVGGPISRGELAPLCAEAKALGLDATVG
jgi:pyruvate formate lyase activating enzyme